MQLAVIIALLVWLGVLARLFIDIGRARTLSDEFFSIGSAIVWGGVGIVGVANSFYFWSCYE